MARIKNFGIIGGDKRQLALADSISSDGYSVCVAGFEALELDTSAKRASVDEVISCSDCIILPLPATRDLKTLNAPFSESAILLDDKFVNSMRGKTVFCGIAPTLLQTSAAWREVKVQDYYEREDFMIKNAVPTAEGAIELAMREYLGTISGSSCLVAGFGRIGKVLARMLAGIGANVTVSARKAADLAWIGVLGYRPVKTAQIRQTRGYQIIFNTIPAMTFDEQTLVACAEGALIIDLASPPGGVDFEAAERLGLHAIQALSLPGKVAPLAAGEITKTTIYNMLEEEDE